MRILIVEHDYVSRYQLEDVLVKWGHDIVSCQDYEAAWQILKRGYKPSMVILEWKQANMDGIRICQEIRCQLADQYTFILLLTMEDNLEDRLLGMDAGADNYINRPFSLIELRSQLEVAGRIVRSRSELLSSLEYKQTGTFRDSLTGLWSQTEIIDILARETDRARREKSYIAAVMIGLDRLHEINSHHGREVGNEVLCKVAKRMSSSLRQYDFLGRYGGEGFLVVLTACQEKSIISVAEKIITVIGSKMESTKGKNTIISITANVGVAINKNPEEKNAGLLIQAADSALLQAREDSRNRLKVTSLQ